MPGIAGFTSSGGEPSRWSDALKAMQNLLTHQPDYVRDELFADGQVCGTRAHTNIIQKQPQPCTGVKDLVVWLDGEFYNQAELMPASAGRTDPEILATLFGNDPSFSFLNRIDGVYSAVIYEKAAGKVHLITDRYGLRHLYWTKHRDSLAWSSEFKGFLALPGFSPRIDRQTVADFFGVGHLLENRTWLEGVELLPPGTALTWDLQTRRSTLTKYWDWNAIKPLAEPIDEAEVVEELSRLWIKAVERQCPREGSVGVPLSGGLDSRAILAAVPQGRGSIHAITFGKRGCDDIRIAALVAQAKGAIHHIVEIGPDNWLAPRFEAIWWTDGQSDVLNLHGIEALPEARRHFQIALSGFWGDVVAGGTGIGDPQQPFEKRYYNRARRFIICGPRMLNCSMQTRFPFFDNAYMNFVRAIPEARRANHRIYARMLLSAFPEFFRDIPWQHSRAPIRWSRPRQVIVKQWRRVLSRLRAELSRLGMRYEDAIPYTDYPGWMRDEPARQFINETLSNKAAIYGEYVPRQAVIEKLNQHFAGEDHSKKLSLYLTFEVWLQQVFNGKFRTAPDVSSLKSSTPHG